MDPTTRYVRAAGTVERRTDQRVYLYRRGWDEIMILEGLGTWVWQCLAEPVSLEELADDVVSVFDDPERGAQLDGLFVHLLQCSAISGGLALTP